MTSPITIRCLGPMQVESGGELWLPKGKPAHLLALLVVHRKVMVRVDTLIDELWLGEPVGQADTAFRIYVAEIRKRIGYEGLIHEDRFARLSPSLVFDIDEFAALIGGGVELATEDPASARGLLEQALTMWRGEPFHGFELPAGLSAASSLEELRAVAEETLAMAQIGTGELVRGIVELRRLVAERPEREFRSLLLMNAFATNGRSAEAFRVYEAYRVHLRDEYSVIPGPQILALHRELLERTAETSNVEGKEHGDPADLANELEEVAPDWNLFVQRKEEAFDAAVARQEYELAAEGLLVLEPGGRSFFWR